MGYPMALNLRRKIPHSARFLFSEVNTETVERFKIDSKEIGEVIQVKTPREISEQAVSQATNFRL
jgi:3-hydroxyisobutyrate dehydrogenase